MKKNKYDSLGIIFIVGLILSGMYYFHRIDVKKNETKRRIESLKSLMEMSKTDKAFFDTSFDAFQTEQHKKINEIDLEVYKQLDPDILKAASNYFMADKDQYIVASAEVEKSNYGFAELSNCSDRSFFREKEESEEESNEVSCNLNKKGIVTFKCFDCKILNYGYKEFGGRIYFSIQKKQSQVVNVKEYSFRIIGIDFDRNSLEKGWSDDYQSFSNELQKLAAVNEK